MKTEITLLAQILAVAMHISKQLGADEYELLQMIGQVSKNVKDAHQ